MKDNDHPKGCICHKCELMRELNKEIDVLVAQSKKVDALNAKLMELIK